MLVFRRYVRRIMYKRNLCVYTEHVHFLTFLSYTGCSFGSFI